MALRRAGLAVLAAAGTLALVAGCGGGTTSDAGSAAALVPKSAPVYVAVATDEEGEQWRTAGDLLERLPFGAAFAGEVDGVAWSDVTAALGPESAYVLLDSAHGEDSLVGLTQPDDVDAFKKLSAEDDSAVREIDGWWAIADSEAVLDRFEEARKDGALADQDAFQDAVDGLPDERLAIVYANPEAGLSSAPTAGMLDEQALRCLTGGDEQRPVAFAVSATDGGFRLDASETPTAFEVTSAASGLDDRLPAGALAFASMHNGAAALRHVLECATGSLGLQLGQLEAFTGISPEKDLLPLFEGETALAVYPEPEPTDMSVVAVTEVADTEDVLASFDRHLQALGPLAGNLAVREQTLEGLAVHVVTRDGQPLFAYAARDGLFALSNAPAGVLVLQAGGKTLAEDEDYVAAREAAGAPDETAGFLYANASALTSLFSGQGPAGAKGLGGLVVWGEQSGDGVTAQGFLAID